MEMHFINFRLGSSVSKAGFCSSHHERVWKRKKFLTAPPFFSRKSNCGTFDGKYHSPHFVQRQTKTFLFGQEDPKKSVSNLPKPLWKRNFFLFSISPSFPFPQNTWTCVACRPVIAWYSFSEETARSRRLTGKILESDWDKTVPRTRYKRKRGKNDSISVRFSLSFPTYVPYFSPSQRTASNLFRSLPPPPPQNSDYVNGSKMARGQPSPTKPNPPKPKRCEGSNPPKLSQHTPIPISKWFGLLRDMEMFLASDRIISSPTRKVIMVAPLSSFFSGCCGTWVSLTGKRGVGLVNSLPPPPF